MNEPHVLLQSESPEAVNHWRSLLADVACEAIEPANESSSDTIPDVVITDGSISINSSSVDERKRLLTGVIAIGIDVDCDVSLPNDVSARELQTACQLLFEIVQLRRRCAKHEQTEQTLKTLAECDPLTGLANRRAWDAELSRRHELLKDNRTSLCVALIDLDEFKRVNTECGYTIADDVLRRVAESLRSSVRADDFVARLGGDEFGILLANISPDHIATVVDRIRQQLAMPLETATNFHLTATAGIAVADSHTDPKDWVDASDTNLREGKRLGRNQTVASI